MADERTRELAERDSDDRFVDSELAELAADAETAAHYTAEADKTEARLKPLHAAALDPDLIGDPAAETSARRDGPLA